MIRLCDFDLDSKWKLLYRASRDGFDAKDFHRTCDGVPYTLTVIKAASSGNIFGGFTSRYWSSERRSIKDSHAFIFSLVNEEERPFKVCCPDKLNAVGTNPYIGPSFGGSNSQYKMDICIRTNSNVSDKNSSDFGSSYKHPDYKFGSNRANSVLAGAKNFKVEEIEVFRLTDQRFKRKNSL